MDWNDVRYFLALARAGSVRTAGAQLKVSHSTVARRVEALEARLDARLFDRSADGYRLTDAGRLLLPGAERVELEMAGVERAMVGRDERMSGVVTLTCGDGFLASFLIQALAPFLLTHPEIELRLITDARPFDLTRREADLAVRALIPGVKPPDALLGARVAPIVLANYVAVAHEARLLNHDGAPTTRWLAFGASEVTEQLVGGSSYPDLPHWGSFDRLEAYLSAAQAGLGVAMLPVYAGDHAPGVRRLDRADARHVADFWLLCHPDLRHTARVQAVRGAITGAFAQAAARFRG